MFDEEDVFPSERQWRMRMTESGVQSQHFTSTHECEWEERELPTCAVGGCPQVNSNLFIWFVKFMLGMREAVTEALRIRVGNHIKP